MQKRNIIAGLMGVVAVVLVVIVAVTALNGGFSEEEETEYKAPSVAEETKPEQREATEPVKAEATEPVATKDDAIAKINEIYAIMVDVDTMYDVLPQRLLDLTSANAPETYSRLEDDENILNNAASEIHRINDEGAESVTGAALAFIIDVDVYRSAVERYIESNGDSRIMGDIQAAIDDMKAGRDHFVEEQINYLVSAGCAEEEAKENIYLGDYE